MFKMVVTLLEVSEQEEGVVALHLHTRLLKTCFGLEPVLRYAKPSTYQPISCNSSKVLFSQQINGWLSLSLSD